MKYSISIDIAKFEDNKDGSADLALLVDYNAGKQYYSIEVPIHFKDKVLQVDDFLSRNWTNVQDCFRGEMIEALRNVDGMKVYL